MTTTRLPDLETLAALAREAGERILEIYATEFAVRLKEDQSPVTQADMAAHHMILAGLAERFPGIPLLSEEGPPIPYAERRGWNRYWLVDPLDGTREFVKRNGEFTVNIALIEGRRPILGVVYAPVKGLTYFARRGGGAYKQGRGQEPTRIHVRTLPPGAIVIAGSRSHRGNSLERFLARIGEYEIFGMGSSLKSCLVAEGAADLYPRFGPTSEWDTAAAQCIVEEAGGRFTDTQLRPLRYNSKESLLNPHFFVFGDASRDWSRYLS